MKIAKAIKIDKGKIPAMEEAGFSDFKLRILEVAKRYNTTEIKLFDQDGTNIRDNKVTIMFYSQS